MEYIHYLRSIRWIRSLFYVVCIYMVPSPRIFFCPDALSTTINEELVIHHLSTLWLIRFWLTVSLKRKGWIEWIPSTFAILPDHSFYFLRRQLHVPTYDGGDLFRIRQRAKDMKEQVSFRFNGAGCYAWPPRQWLKKLDCGFCALTVAGTRYIMKHTLAGSLLVITPPAFQSSFWNETSF
jgi:hypothetical protein